jgi:NAD(P)H-hydrate epimerase
MREVDRLMVEELGIEVLQMMESAGLCLARLARDRFLEGRPTSRTVTVLAGPGGNGGGAMVCARRLAGWGATVSVALARTPNELTPAAALQLTILHRMGVCVISPEPGERTLPPAADLLIDGLIGYGLAGQPRGSAADLVRWTREQETPVLSLDVPTGVDATQGSIHEPAVRAAATLTLALPKEGLRRQPAASAAGELYLADIGVPPELYAKPSLGLRVGPVFARRDIIRLR